jgi:hypothetical protein
VSREITCRLASEIFTGFQLFMLCKAVNSPPSHMKIS